MVLIGSSTAITAKVAVRELPVELVPLIRFGVAGLCVLPWAWRHGGLIRALRDDLPRLFAAAMLCVPVNQAFFLNGAKLAPAAHVGLIYASCPLVVLMLAVALGQERMRWNRLAGVMLTMLGVAVLGFESLRHSLSPAGSANLAWGDLLLVGAVVSWGAYLTVAKPLIVRHGSIPILAGTFLLGSLLEFPITLAAADPDLSARLSTVSATAWQSLAFLTLVVTVFGLSLQNQAMRRMDASQVAAVGNLSPVLTVVWAVWLLGEPVSANLVVGGLLTLGGVYWTQRRA